MKSNREDVSREENGYHGSLGTVLQYLERAEWLVETGVRGWAKGLEKASDNVGAVPIDGVLQIVVAILKDVTKLRADLLNAECELTILKEFYDK